jgi:succinylarginine dihydrolase
MTPEKSLTRPGFVEVNFDGLVGPTHNYAGLSRGNLASARHADTVSHPKLAALQGLAKMKLLMEMGVPQGIFLPQPRPNMQVLRRLGFLGSDAQMLSECYRTDPKLLAAVYSSSAMWSANAATVSPAADTGDGRIHITPANLLTQFHRSIEPAVTAEMLKHKFDSHTFSHHDPLPAADALADEGAANHLRLCNRQGETGLEIFVYGRDETTAATRYPARQTRQACVALARLHGLDFNRTLMIRQSAEAIDAGAFHNDVVAASNQQVLMVHRQAFADSDAIAFIQQKFRELGGAELEVFIAEPQEVSLADAVSTYLFNSQIVTLPDESMALIAPMECQEHAGVQKFLTRVLAADSPIKTVKYVDLRQSMHNGGGPACLRLRIVMSAEQAGLYLLSDELIDKFSQVIRRRYRDELHPKDLADPRLLLEAKLALDELHQVQSAPPPPSPLSVLA